MENRPPRSVLYLPGANARALEKAREIPTDAIILDLEDSIAPDAKEMARYQVTKAVKTGGYGQREIVVRINGLSTPWGRDDLDAALRADPDAILVPKVSDPADVSAVQEAITTAGSRTQIWAMIETPLSIGNVFSLAGARTTLTTALSAFVIGTNDLVKEMQMRPTPGRAHLVPLLATCVAAARAHGIHIIDGVYNALDDEDGFRAECEQGRDLGMDGKSLIHPRQVQPCNSAFSPSKDEIARARRLVEVFDLPENRDAGVLRIDGHMAERLHLHVAKQILAAADRLDSSHSIDE
ncbi:MAG: CoA ester lyase [Mesorhizobium sp.]